MEFRYTRHQVARNAKPDTEQFNKMYLIKNVKNLRATYQIKLLALKAAEKKIKLILRVPASCKFDSSLKDLIKNSGKTIVRENY